MSVDESATSDQQKLALGAGSDAREHELPVESGKLVGASEHPSYPTDLAAGVTEPPADPTATEMPSPNVDAIIRREGNVGVTDADWHSSQATPIPAPKTKDELIEHLSEALAEMASDFTEMPTDPRNTPGVLEAAKTANQMPPPPPSLGQSPPPQLAAPLPLHQHIGPSQQIRSSLPPGSVPSQTNPQMPAMQPQPADSQMNRANENQAAIPRNVISDQLSQAAAAAQQSQTDQRAQPTQQPVAPASSPWGPPAGVSQDSVSEPINSSNVATGDHATVQRPNPPPQHYFVLEDLAPPATPSNAASDQAAKDKSSSGAKSPDEHQTPTDLDAAIIDAANVPPERRTQFEVTTPIPLQPKDGLQIRRLIATQQGIPAAIPIAGNEQEPGLPAERTFRAPVRSETEQSSPNVPLPQANEVQKAVGTASGTNQVSLPPMFGGRPTSPPKDTEPASDADQQKAHTGLQALPALNKQPKDLKAEGDLAPAGELPITPASVKHQGIEAHLTAPATLHPTTPLAVDADEKAVPTKPSSQPLLTGHNFQPRQSDPRSSMSALAAMPAPLPAMPLPGQPVSPLSAALASSLPSNPPTGQHTVPAALREPRSTNADPGAAPSSATETPASAAPSVSATASGVQAPLANPLGPANSRPVPTLDSSGAVNPPPNPLGPAGPAIASPSAPSAINSAGRTTVPPNVEPVGGQPALPSSTGPNISPVFRPTNPNPSSGPMVAASNNNSNNNPLGSPGNAGPNINPLGAAGNAGPNISPIVSRSNTAENPPAAPTVPSPATGQTASNNGTTAQSPPQNPVNHPASVGPATSANATGAPFGHSTFGSNPSALPLEQPGSVSQPISHAVITNARAANSYPTTTADAADMPNFTEQLSPKMLPPRIEVTGPQAPINESLNLNAKTSTGGLPDAAPPAPTTPLSAPNTPPNPQLFPIKPANSRTTYNDLREETGMVMPHSAPEPEPNQRISKEFGKSVPGITPVSKPFETATGKERREAKERELEALNKIQLPAKVQAKPAETEQSSDSEIKQNEPAAKETKPRKQADSGRAARFSNLLHESPASAAGSKSLRKSQSGGALPGIIDGLRTHWRLAIAASLAIPLVLSVSALVAMTGKSFIGFNTSPSQKAGEEAFADGNYDRAVNYFNEAIKADEKKPELYHDRARANLHLQEYAAAVADYTSALNLDKNFTSARLDRAAAYYFLGNYTKAIADYDELIKNNSNNVDAYFGRGLSYSKLHKFEPALADLNKVVSINPQHSGAFEDIANAYLALGRLNEAVDAYSRSIKNNPRDANAYYMRANTYKRLGKTTEALTDFSSAIGIAPGRYEFYNDRGFTQYESGKYRDAIADLTTALLLNPSYEMARDNRKAACDRFIASIGPAPKNVEAMADLAYAYYNSENYPAALAAANKALLYNSLYRPAMNIRAAVELKQKRFDYALTDADNILKIKADDKEALLTRARAYLNQGHYDRAIKDYDTCVSENGNTSLFALRERALAHLLANEGALAAADAQQFMDLNGWNNSLAGPTVLLSWLAKRQLQDLDGASAVLSQAETRLKSTQWPFPIVKFLKHEITLAQVNALARNDRERTDVRTWSGYDHVLGGLRDEGRADFDWVKRNGYSDNDDYLLAKEQLQADDGTTAR